MMFRLTNIKFEVSSQPLLFQRGVELVSRVVYEVLSHPISEIRDVKWVLTLVEIVFDFQLLNFVHHSVGLKVLLILLHLCRGRRYFQRAPFDVSLIILNLDYKHIIFRGLISCPMDLKLR